MASTQTDKHQSPIL